MTAQAAAAASLPVDIDAVCRRVSVPPVPDHRAILARAALTLTESENINFYAHWRDDHLLTSMMGLRPLALSPPPTSGRRLRLWVGHTGGPTDKMIEISGPPGREEVRAYAWWGRGVDAHAREEFGAGPCRDLVCSDMRRACVIDAPRCLPTLLPPTPSAPAPLSSEPTVHGSMLIVEHLDHERYWIGGYRDFFPGAPVDELDFIRFLDGFKDDPRCPEEVTRE
ncbi:MAG: hypothetical protein R3B09_09010 [Nannocystaceae bacterium]